LEKGFKNIVAIGGDGTINEVANGFFTFNNKEQHGGEIEEHNNNEKKIENVAYPPPIKQINPDAVFGIISSGTRNVLVKSLDLPSETFECCKHYGASKLQKKIDVISATVTSFPE